MRNTLTDFFIVGVGEHVVEVEVENLLGGLVLCPDLLLEGGDLVV